MKKPICVFALVFFLLSCQNDGMENTKLEGSEEMFKIEYYSVRIKSSPLQVSGPSDWEYDYVLIKTEEGGKNYNVADYNDMIDEWDWEREIRFSNFYAWAIDKPYHEYIGYATGIYQSGKKMNVTEDMVFYTLWETPRVVR